MTFDGFAMAQFLFIVMHSNILHYLIATLVVVVSMNVQGTTKLLVGTHTLSLWAFQVAKISRSIVFVAHDYKSKCDQANSSQHRELILLSWDLFM